MLMWDVREVLTDETLTLSHAGVATSHIYNYISLQSPGVVATSHNLYLSRVQGPLQLPIRYVLRYYISPDSRAVCVPSPLLYQYNFNVVCHWRLFQFAWGHIYPGAGLFLMNFNLFRIFCQKEALNINPPRRFSCLCIRCF